VRLTVIGCSGSFPGPDSPASCYLVEHDGFVRDHRPDLVLRIGRTTLSRGLAALLEGRTEEILIDAHGRWWDPRRAMSELVVADPVDALQRVAAEIAIDTSSTWSDEWRAADTAVRVALDEHLSAGGGQVGARAVRAAVRAAAEDASILVASSLAIRHLDRHPERRPDVTWFANRGVAGIDGTVSTAFGIALARAAEEQRRPTVAIVGDLAALHDTNAWLLVPDVETLDLTLVVVDDNGGAIFDLLPPSRFPAQRRLFATPHGRDLTRLAALHDLPLVSVREDQIDQGFPRSGYSCIWYFSWADS
jgi:2-succinyl-5-enolpyruvyl-6-hydroxy-3-cyclohexene-1-carboxylate synthase